MSDDASSVSLREHLLALRTADLRFEDERDRRYTEVTAEHQRAMELKDAGDQRALNLARQIQNYKDEKANELRAQIERERGNYLSRSEYEAKHEALIQELRGLREMLAEISSRNQSDIAELRTSQAVGPPELHVLSQGAARHEGERTSAADSRRLLLDSRRLMLAGIGTVIAFFTVVLPFVTVAITTHGFK